MVVSNSMTCEPNLAFRPFKWKLLSHTEISSTIIMWIANTHPQPRQLRKRRSHSFSHQHDLKSPDSQQRCEAVTGKLHCHCRHSDDLHFSRAHYPKVQGLSGSPSYHTLLVQHSKNCIMCIIISSLSPSWKENPGFRCTKYTTGLVCQVRECHTNLLSSLRRTYRESLKARDPPNHPKTKQASRRT